MIWLRRVFRRERVCVHEPFLVPTQVPFFADSDVEDPVYFCTCRRCPAWLKITVARDGSLSVEQRVRSRPFLELVP